MHTKDRPQPTAANAGLGNVHPLVAEAKEPLNGNPNDDGLLFRGPSPYRGLRDDSRSSVTNHGRGPEGDRYGGDQAVSGRDRSTCAELDVNGDRFEFGIRERSIQGKHISAPRGHLHRAFDYRPSGELVLSARHT